MDYCNLVFYVPESHLETVKSAIFAAGGGKLGNYDCCCWQCAGEGQFRPLAGSDPFLGGLNQLEKVREYRVELLVVKDVLPQVLSALKTSHPYETIAFHYWDVKTSFEQES